MVHLLERYRTVAAPVTSHMLAPSAPFMACPLALLHAGAHSGPIRTAVPRVDACPQTSRLDLLLEAGFPSVRYLAVSQYDTRECLVSGMTLVSAKLSA